jgi:hypothetical protein
VEPTPPTAKSWSQHHHQQNRGANTTISKIVEPKPPTARSMEPTPPTAKSWSQHHQQQNRGANTTNTKTVEPTPPTVKSVKGFLPNLFHFVKKPSLILMCTDTRLQCLTNGTTIKN